jgi:hypothetical protein
MLVDNRKSVRVPSEKFISYTLYDDQKRPCDAGMSVARNVSRSGVALETRTPFDLGAHVELSIALSEDLVRTEGQVRNLSTIENGMFLIGIEFISISDDELQKLRKEFPNIA